MKAALFTFQWKTSLLNISAMSSLLSDAESTLTSQLSTHGIINSVQCHSFCRISVCMVRTPSGTFAAKRQHFSLQAPTKSTLLYLWEPWQCKRAAPYVRKWCDKTRLIHVHVSSCTQVRPETHYHWSPALQAESTRLFASYAAEKWHSGRKQIL